MKRVRPELIRGLAVLAIFCALIISTDLLYPYSSNPAGYTVVGIRRLNENPLPLEGAAISTSATIISVTDHGSYFSAEVSEGATLVFPSSVTSPKEGQRVLLRGTSWLFSNGSIMVHEFYELDSTSSVIRSIPGIVLFIVLFFIVFKFDFKHLAFVPRKEGSESA